MVMVRAEDSISLLVPAKSVWYRLIEFDRWDEWLWRNVPADGKVAMGDNMRPLGGEGLEMRFGLFGDGVQKQTMRVTEWDPPRRLALSLEGWNWRAVERPETRGKERVMEAMGKERATQAIGTFAAMTLAYSAEVSPVSDTETKLTFRIEAGFTHPIGGPLLNLFYCIPWRMSMRKLAADFTESITRSFEKPKAA